MLNYNVSPRLLNVRLASKNIFHERAELNLILISSYYLTKFAFVRFLLLTLVPSSSTGKNLSRLSINYAAYA